MKKPQRRDARPKPAPKGPPEEKYYGVAACVELWRVRPNDVIRIYIREDLVPEFGDLLKWAARERKAYHIVADEDLDRLTRSEHHQGICLLARERLIEPFDLWWAAFRRELPPSALLLYLDGVENPHNLGAIVRTCAHFGVAAILGAADRLPRMSPSACRVAEGGAEYVRLVGMSDVAKQIAELKKSGFDIVATQAAAGAKSLYALEFSGRTVLVMGAEQTGVSNAISRLTDKSVHIPGAGTVESLNVSVAAAIVIGEFSRQALRRGP